jgi:hypothetical protein
MARLETIRHRRQPHRRAVLGHPYMTLADLVADMKGQSVKGDTPAMRAGGLLEVVFPEALKEERPEWGVSKATTYHRCPICASAPPPISG